jgi:hypothetical protein
MKERLVGWGMATALLLAAPAQAQTSLQVQASGELPGFRIADAAPYLATAMTKAGTGWHFLPRDPGEGAPDRIEWTFSVLPYAGGEVRRLFPMPDSQRMDLHLGSHRLISAEAKLFLAGQYQTETVGQEAVKGGDNDPDLAAFLVRLTRNLEQGYNATEMTPAAHHVAQP